MVETFSSAPGHKRSLRHAGRACSLWAMSDGELGRALAALPAQETHYGVVVEGTATLETAAGRFSLASGMVFRAPGTVKVSGGARVVGVSIEDIPGAASALFMLTGPIPARGKLRYIDGCTDSLLIAPEIQGEPCLNLLHFPPGVSQTAHSHPSARLGLVLRGSGVCDCERGRVPLRAGQLFVIEAEAKHRFVTQSEAMDVIAFHPDSDHGPTDDDHPMINRTMVDGVSARELPMIRT